MIVLGLTGSIAMGKSHVACCFASFGIPVFDADASARELMRPGGLGLSPIRAAFPVALDDHDQIDRAKLGQIIFHDAGAKKTLEAILHPLVRANEKVFRLRCKRIDAKLALLDIPLLFETGAAGRVDATIVVHTHVSLRRARALQRLGMTTGKLNAIIKNQLNDDKKRRKADYIIQSGSDRGYTQRQVAAIIQDLGHIRTRSNLNKAK